mmetsp:Transcript_26130/g.66302  ORF Transcript_26130/g.66302 Transcript_26130/m.66302 type:complete len:237 (+) Transcript_26130:305-1015(+)
MTNQQYCFSLAMISGTSTSVPSPADSLPPTTENLPPLALSPPGVLPGRLTPLSPRAGVSLSRGEVSRRAFCRCSCSMTCGLLKSISNLPGVAPFALLAVWAGARHEARRISCAALISAEPRGEEASPPMPTILRSSCSERSTAPSTVSGLAVAVEALESLFFGESGLVSPGSHSSKRRRCFWSSSRNLSCTGWRYSGLSVSSCTSVRPTSCSKSASSIRMTRTNESVFMPRVARMS